MTERELTAEPATPQARLTPSVIAPTAADPTRCRN